MKLVLVGTAASATPERSFSLARSVKTWTRTKRTQKRFNSMPILASYKCIVDNLSIIAVTDDFVANKPLRSNHFGKLTTADL